MTTTKEGGKSWPPGTMNLAGNRSNPIAATKAAPAKRERRHVRTAVATAAQLHTRVNSASRGEVLEVLGHAPQAATIPVTPAARKAPAIRTVPNGLPSGSRIFSSA
jgi:hypothetical protein